MAIDDENESAIRPRRRSLDRDELFSHSFELVRVRNFVQRRFISVIGDVWDVHFVLVRIGVFATQVGVDHREQVASVMCEFVCIYVHVIIFNRNKKCIVVLKALVIVPCSLR